MSIPIAADIKIDRGIGDQRGVVSVPCPPCAQSPASLRQGAIEDNVIGGSLAARVPQIIEASQSVIVRLALRSPGDGPPSSTRSSERDFLLWNVCRDPDLSRLAMVIIA